ncbi:glutamate ligase domain-containing protein [Leptospira wolffii]|uniref:Dihydrofolate synthase/folylpolyglutamate synthase n=1 Tax=Leptospira wolffii TaxID=409998 RepID=A0ABV5BJX3_9LEPT
MESPEFLEFASRLTNLEKTRNFNVFGAYSLDPFRDLLDRYGWRNRKKERLRISVVGTNGKGSISHFLAECFSKLGFSVGLYTSPHLKDPRERIRLSPELRPVKDEDLKELTKLLFSDSSREELSSLSWFEWFTLAAFVLFEEKDRSVQIYEAGLGGRLDATKLAEPDVVIVCAIGEDHKAVLGNTKESILKEKLGIISDRTRLVFALEPEPSLQIILEEFCEEKHIDLATFPSLPQGKSYLRHNQEFVKFIVPRLMEVLAKKRILPENKGEEIVQDLSPPPGRLEIVSDSPFIVFDPAHNPDAVRITLSSLGTAFPGKKFSIIAGFLPDKEGESMAKDLTDYTKAKNTDLYFLNAKEFLLPKGFESFVVSPEKLSEKLESVNAKGEGILVLGSFRMYSYISQKD